MLAKQGDMESLHTRLLNTILLIVALKILRSFNGIILFLEIYPEEMI